MMNPKRKSTALVVGAAAGAILMALVITMVFGLKTGIAGAVLMILIVAVSAVSGWLIGLNWHIEKRNYYSYLRGYREGLAKKTTIIERPMCRCTFTVSDRIGDKSPDLIRN